MITETDQEGLDIDWFFTDGAQVYFAASGGGKLPASVATSEADLTTLRNHIITLPSIAKAIINPELSEILQDDVTERYLETFVEMTEKGIFAYDKTAPMIFSDTRYHLVASPTVLLLIKNLPQDIAKIIGRSQYKGEIVGLIDIKIID